MTFLTVAVIADFVPNLDPGGIIAWIIVGLLAGSLAAWVMPGRGFGLIGNLLLGLVGAVVGGFIARALLPNDPTYGFWGSLFVSFLGACLIFFLVSLFRGRRTA